jgi:UDP-glucose:(heptosyl)LPS alpha-1,3-glucosyltransferase
MRVGLVIDDIDPQRGGMSQWCRQFVSALAQRKYELHVVSQGFGNAALPESVAFHPIPRTNSRIAFARAAETVVRRLELDVVHDTGIGWQFDVFQPHGGSYAAWLRRRLDIYPFLYRMWKRPIDALLPRHRDFNRHSRRQYAAGRVGNKTFVALSQMVADDFVQHHGIRPAQIKVVYNGVDCRRFSPDQRGRYREFVRRRLGVNGETIVLLLAAHNFRLKGVPELLRLAARLARSRRPVVVLIAGGKRLEKWRRSAERFGLKAPSPSGRGQGEGGVTFLGTVADMVPYYAAADAYVHPTYYDPCSLVLLEAAASGLPIVTTRRFNGAAELFREGEEILTVAEPSAEDALYERVDALFDDRLRNSLGAAARRVALRHPFEKNVAEILRLYDGRLRLRAAA